VARQTGMEPEQKMTELVQTNWGGLSVATIGTATNEPFDETAPMLATHGSKEHSSWTGVVSGGSH
jgi:hypothetical protein